MYREVENVFNIEEKYGQKGGQETKLYIYDPEKQRMIEIIKVEKEREDTEIVLGEIQLITRN